MLDRLFLRGFGLRFRFFVPPGGRFPGRLFSDVVKSRKQKQIRCKIRYQRTLTLAHARYKGGKLRRSETVPQEQLRQRLPCRLRIRAAEEIFSKLPAVQ